MKMQKTIAWVLLGCIWSFSFPLNAGAADLQPVSSDPYLIPAGPAGVDPTAPDPALKTMQAQALAMTVPVVASGTVIDNPPGTELAQIAELSIEPVATSLGISASQIAWIRAEYQEPTISYRAWIEVQDTNGTNYFGRVLVGYVFPLDGQGGGTTISVDWVVNLSGARAREEMIAHSIDPYASADQIYSVRMANPVNGIAAAEVVAFTGDFSDPYATYVGQMKAFTFQGVTVYAPQWFAASSYGVDTVIAVAQRIGVWPGDVARVSQGDSTSAVVSVRSGRYGPEMKYAVGLVQTSQTDALGYKIYQTDWAIQTFIGGYFTVQSIRNVSNFLGVGLSNIRWIRIVSDSAGGNNFFGEVMLKDGTCYYGELSFTSVPLPQSGQLDTYTPKWFVKAPYGYSVETLKKIAGKIGISPTQLLSIRLVDSTSAVVSVRDMNGVITAYAVGLIRMFKMDAMGYGIYEADWAIKTTINIASIRNISNFLGVALSNIASINVAFDPAGGNNSFGVVKLIDGTRYVGELSFTSVPLPQTGQEYTYTPKWFVKAMEGISATAVKNIAAYLVIGVTQISSVKMANEPNFPIEVRLSDGRRYVGRLAAGVEQVSWLVQVPEGIGVKTVDNMAYVMGITPGSILKVVATTESAPLGRKVDVTLRNGKKYRTYLQTVTGKFDSFGEPLYRVYKLWKWTYGVLGWSWVGITFPYPKYLY